MFDNPGLTSGAPAMRLGASMSPVRVEGSGADGPAPVDARFLTARAFASVVRHVVTGDRPWNSPWSCTGPLAQSAQSVGFSARSSPVFGVERRPVRNG